MSLIQFDAVKLAFNKHLPILKKIDFNVDHGDFLIILGSNGSGKSSLLKLLEKTYTPSAGKISFHGTNLTKLTYGEINQKIRMLSQSLDQVVIYEMTLFENFKLWQSCKGTSQLSREAFQAYIKDFLPALAEKLDVALYKLSGGERQIFALGLILLNPPELLLLDEHTSALDPKRGKMIMQLTNNKIKQHDLTALMVTHNLSDALQYGNKLVVLHQGEIKHRFDEKKKAKLTLEKLRNLYQE